MDSPTNILVIKSSSLGDIVHALPAVSALRHRWPHARITWLIKESLADVLDGNPDLDEIWPVNFSCQFWPAILHKLWNGTFDVVVDFQGLFRSGFLAWVSGAPRRIGFAKAREGAPLFYTEKVDLPALNGVPWRLGPMHAVDRNFALVRHLGADPLRGNWHLPQHPEDQTIIEQLLRKAGVRKSDSLIAIAPWSRAAWKCWPLEHFVELCRRLTMKKAIRPVLVGSRQDKEGARAFKNLHGVGLMDCVGQVSLRQLPVLLRHMEALVGNDSAPLHIAAGVGIPVVGLYGPTHYKATGPYPVDRQIILHSALPCAPCGCRTCSQPIQQECLRVIGVQEVFEKLCSVLSSSSVRTISDGSFTNDQMESP